MTGTYTETIRMDAVECCKCGMLFCMTQERNRELLENGGSFYCPNGHLQHYCETEVQRLRKQVERATRNAELYEAQRDRARTERDANQRKLRATRGVVTRTKNRIRCGLCPCCNRHFENLERHMSSKHPQYAKDE